MNIGMERARPPTRKAHIYIDVLDVPSITEAVNEASVMLREGILRAMSSNVREPPHVDEMSPTTATTTVPQAAAVSAPVANSTGGGGVVVTTGAGSGAGAEGAGGGGGAGAGAGAGAATGGMIGTGTSGRDRDPMSIYSAAVAKRPRAEATQNSGRDPLAVYTAVTKASSSRGKMGEDGAAMAADAASVRQGSVGEEGGERPHPPTQAGPQPDKVFAAASLGSKSAGEASTQNGNCSTPRGPQKFSPTPIQPPLAAASSSAAPAAAPLAQPALRTWDRDKKAGPSILSKRGRSLPVETSGSASVFQPAPKRERRDTRPLPTNAGAGLAGAEEKREGDTSGAHAGVAAMPAPLSENNAHATANAVKAAGSGGISNAVTEPVVKAKANSSSPVASAHTTGQRAQTTVQGESPVETMLQSAIPRSATPNPVAPSLAASKLAAAKATGPKVSTPKVAAVSSPPVGVSKPATTSVPKSPTAVSKSSAASPKSPATAIKSSAAASKSPAARKVGHATNAVRKKVTEKAKEDEETIETAEGAAAAMAAAAAGRFNSRRSASGPAGATIPLGAAHSTAAMSLLRRKMATGSTGRGPARDGPTDPPTPTLAQQEAFARRAAALSNTASNDVKATTGKKAGASAGAGAGAGAGADVHFIPGSQPINDVPPNGYTVTSTGVVRPLVTFTNRPRVPYKLRQFVLLKIFEAWCEQEKTSEAVALQNSLQTEQETYARSASRVEYRTAMMAKLKSIREGRE